MKKTISLVLVLVFVTGPIPSFAKAKLVACVGDNDTYGYGLPDRQNNCYPAQLERILREVDNNWETRNFGVPAAGVLSEGYMVTPYIDQYAYKSALNCEPDVVIIGLGINDVFHDHKNFISEYSALIDSFSELPSQPVIWICTAAWFVSSPYGHDRTKLKNVTNPLIQQVGTIKNVPVIDWYTLLEDKPHLYQGDGIRWNIEGAKLVAELVAAEILRSFWPPDFNGDSKVNIEDLVILIENWEQDEPSVDIVPRPFGDGTVDVQDLEVLMSYWGQEPNDPTLVAHWELDEAEGMFATDSVGDNDAFIVGGIEWQPNNGQLNGALQLDGASGCAIAGFALNPTDGPFSIIAWVKGDAPGQVIVSQQATANWLATDAEGNLMTELKSSDPLAEPLFSETVITDGAWHRIGLVWDGSHRTLYVDSVAVAEDTQPGLESSQMGLYIGVDKNYAPGTFFSGMIDDIRIYNRVIKP